MKILISILLISSVAFFSNNQLSSNILEGCNCSSLTCSCSVTGCNSGGNCSCNLFSCSCECSSIVKLPTANGTQNENSIASQEYFENLETAAGTTIAGYIETLRNAIANDDLDTYTDNAPLLNSAFKNLKENEQSAYTSWVIANLTPIKD